MKFFLFVAFCFNALLLFAQNTRDIVAGEIIYGYKIMEDSTKPSKYYTEELELDFGKNSSVFYSYTFKSTSILEDKRMDALMANAKKDANGNISIVDNGHSLFRGSNISYYTFLNDKKLYQLQPFSGNRYAIEQPVKNIEWKILDSTKNIGGYICQKATGRSFGRTYIAWFAADLPYPFGPRKLHGLPGLILEAHDDRNQVIYNFEKIDIHPDSSDIISLPDKAIVTNQADFDKATDTYYKNPEAFKSNQVGSVQISMTNSSGEPYKPRKPLPPKNPIELSDN